jgi:hypothetical protein
MVACWLAGDGNQRMRLASAVMGMAVFRYVFNNFQRLY